MDDRRLLLLVFALSLGLLAAARPTRAQTAENALRFTQRAPATGARMTGLSGTGIAGFADYGMLYTNPAGLGYFETSRVAGAFGMLTTRDESRYQVGTGEPSLAEESTTGYTGNFALVYKIPTERGSFVLAGAYNSVGTYQRTLAFEGVNSVNSITDVFLPTRDEYVLNDGGVIFPDDIPSNILPFIAYQAGAIEFLSDPCPDDGYPFCQAVYPLTTIGQQGTVTREGRLSEISFGGALEVARDVMVGLSVNIAVGTYQFENFYTETDINGENTPGLYEVYLDNSTLRGFDALEFRESFTSDLVGVNLRGGLSAALSPSLRVGLTLETPTFYQVSETYMTAAITTYFDEGGSLSYGDRPGDVGQGAFDYEIRTPWRIGAGVAFNTAALTDGDVNLTLLADAELVDWSQLEVSAEGTDFSEVNRALAEFKTVVSPRFGAEWRLGDAALRAGFAYQPDQRDYTIALPENETADRSKTFFSAGFSYHLNEQVRLDLAWSQVRFDDQYRPYPSIEVPGTEAEIVSPYVDEDVVRNRFLVGLSYSF